MSMSCRKANLFLTFVIMVLLSTSVYADAGLPMIAVIWPGFWVALIPIIVIETLVLRKYLKQISWKKLLEFTTLANCASTFLGVPLTWLALIGIEVATNWGDRLVYRAPESWRYFFEATLTSPWIGHESQFYWMIPVACMTLLIPLFFMSAWSETLILKVAFKAQCAVSEVRRACWRANIVSYIFLYVIVFIFLIFKLAKHFLF